MRISHEIGSKPRPDLYPASSWDRALGVGPVLADLDVWLRRNIRACSEQEYLRYRAYLEAEAEPVSVPVDGE